MKMLLEPGLSAVPLPWGHCRIPTASQSSTDVFLLPALIDDIPKNTSPRKTKVENALRARAFDRPFSLGPRQNSHGFTKLNSCLSSTSVDRGYPKKHKSQKGKG
jgi:hypothetical protein